ncbi:MAG: alpha/beta hydrolase [Dyella sp.]|uniref:alpha/beta hydrolase n=1 Tax=Dyella sp. TaxID=1869338 RepID=UPI003F8002A3
MTLRNALLAVAAACLVGFGTAAAAQAPAGPAPVTFKLWPGPPPDGRGPSGPERIGRSGTGVGAVANISTPRIEVYRPAQPNGTAVLLIGGGGYFRIGIGHEVMPTAQWLAALGVTPVVLYYRLPGEGWTAKAPFQDGERAMRLLRAHAAELGIDPHRIGVLGFSAGGNLAGILATRFGDDFYTPVDAADRQPVRPDFAGLIYPVSSLLPPYGTTRSRRELSTQADADQAYTVQAHITHETSPSFVAHAVDDPIVKVGASIELFQDLIAHGVPAELHVFEHGGHGWGLGTPGTRPAEWPRLFASWCRSRGLLPAPAAASPFAPSAVPSPAASPAPAADADDDSDD